MKPGDRVSVCMICISSNPGQPTEGTGVVTRLDAPYWVVEFADGQEGYYDTHELAVLHDTDPAPAPVAPVAATLEKREKTYGNYSEISRLSQGMQAVMHSGKNWAGLPKDMRESLQLISSKIARILNGDCEHIDSWHDIAGYAELVERRLVEADRKVPDVR